MFCIFSVPKDADGEKKEKAGDFSLDPLRRCDIGRFECYDFPGTKERVMFCLHEGEHGDIPLFNEIFTLKFFRISEKF